MSERANPMLAIEGLTIEIDGNRIVDGVSLGVETGRILAIVGESGCGKSLTALSVLGLLPNAARVSASSIRLGGRELTGLSEAELSQVRGNDAAIIFQEPVASLNPLMRVGEQVEEALLLHRGLSRAAAREEAIAIMARVGIPDPARRARQYPFELSGGMCQRIMIASALICRPSLLIADEPTTALDVTIQAQILDLMRRLRDEVGSAVVLITHDMGVVADLADDVCVMYGGRIVESGPVDAIFAEPSHPYTRLLLGTIPKLDGARKTVLRTIEGMVPPAGAWPEGCRFRTRCPLADEACEQVPPAVTVGASHRAACWHVDRLEAMA
ncbi:peptide/nickel transport system ATP-binding protein [Bosea sp. AK1]|uniref:ABC transporter ATP-binding protein n=1 Tax=Bosea sp. AK1 TaxID=2587160 RepID=UPI000DE55C96|nr:ABC transporter ATP-binding protein [Bosea sp. AK1]TQI75155.1 peptide/nickel transport system ATP-binding protein [Bosea sp. AK1]